MRHLAKHVSSHSRPSRFLQALVQSPTQMPDVWCDHAWFAPESLQSSAFSLSTWEVV